MIYLDNAATTGKKPDEVYLAVYNELINSANPGRSGHKLSMRASEHIYQAREALARLLKTDNIENIILTPNATFALNLAIKGIVKPNTKVITTSMEHNSVIRPLYQLKDCRTETVYGNNFGFINPNAIERRITQDTSLIVINHASNVNGVIQNVDEIAKIARNNNIPILLDASQTIGILDINAENFDLIAFPGHKALYGPQGTGGLYIKPGTELDYFITGGTGSNSKEYVNPRQLPDKFESGTLNTPGFYGLKFGVEFVLKEGISAIHQYETFLLNRLYSGLSDIKKVKIYSPKPQYISSALAFEIVNTDSDIVANKLDEKFNIAVRGGFHCAYNAHKNLGSEKRGLVRASVSYFNTKKEIDSLIWAIHKLSNE